MSADPMQVLETTLENGQPISWETTLIVFWHHQMRRGSVAGIEERTATGKRTVKVRGTVENDYSTDKGEARKVIVNVPDMVHLDSPDTGRTRFLTWAERGRIAELHAFAVKTGQVAPGGGSGSVFLPAGKSKDDVIDEAQWTRGGDKGTGQTDTKGPGSAGSIFQPTGQGADNQTSEPAEPIPDRPFQSATNVPPKKDKDKDRDGVPASQDADDRDPNVQ